MANIGNKELPLVSVVMPAYNASQYITETIESVLSQTYKNIEIIVVDDGSTDDTEVTVSFFGNKISYVHQNNTGVSSARNAGILRSKGEFITCIDADDIMHPEKVARQVAFINKNTHVPIVFTDYSNFSVTHYDEMPHFRTCKKLMDILRQNYEDYILKSEDALNILVEENFTIAGTPLFSKNALNRVGLYDSFLSQGEDYELHYRFAKHYPIGVINEILLYRRLHEKNATKKLNTLYQKAGMSRQKILLYEENKGLRKKIKKWLNCLYLSIAYNALKQDRIKSIKMTVYSLKFGFDRIVLKNLFKAVTW